MTLCWRFLMTSMFLKPCKSKKQPDVVSDVVLDLTQPHVPGDAILLVGVGEVYPFLRVHNLFDSMQSDFSDVPVIAAYPGTFNGSSVTLFNRLAAENYYRAIDIS